MLLINDSKNETSGNENLKLPNSGKKVEKDWNLEIFIQNQAYEFSILKLYKCLFEQWANLNY